MIFLLGYVQQFTVIDNPKVIWDRRVGVEKYLDIQQNIELDIKQLKVSLNMIKRVKDRDDGEDANYWKSLIIQMLDRSFKKHCSENSLLDKLFWK